MKKGGWQGGSKMRNPRGKRGSKWSNAVNLERILVEIGRVWARLSAVSSSLSAKAVQNDHIKPASILFFRPRILLLFRFLLRFRLFLGLGFGHGLRFPLGRGDLARRLVDGRQWADADRPIVFRRHVAQTDDEPVIGREINPIGCGVHDWNIELTQVDSRSAADRFRKGSVGAGRRKRAICRGDRECRGTRSWLRRSDPLGVPNARQPTLPCGPGKPRRCHRPKRRRACRSRMACGCSSRRPRHASRCPRRPRGCHSWR